MRPGASLTAEDRRHALQVAEAKATRVLDELFEKRGVCSTCHHAQRDRNGGWRVAPVHITEVWMPHALFDHAKHSTQSCTSCHAVRDSKRAEDLAMPTIVKCRECHAGAQPVLGRVTSDCANCHHFHAGRELWGGAPQGIGTPGRQPNPAARSGS
jgi:hypothetical protein